MPSQTAEQQSEKDPKDLAARPSGAIAAPAGRGLEQEVDPRDIILPRARLMQPTTPEVIEQSVPGARMGALMNSITKDILPMEFVPIVFFKNWGRFNPRKKDDPHFDPAHEPGDTIWLSFDRDDPRVVKEAAWGPNGEKPAATAFLNFLAYFPGQPMPLILSFSKTSYKAGKQLLSLATMLGGDLFSHKYRITTETHKNDQGTYAVMKVDPAGAASPEEQKAGEAWWAQYGKTITSVRMDDLKPEETAPTGAEEDIPF
ncbi:MAG TPA: hypothetical protein VFR02_03590 [bacterium]|nr:hypothetical protein [bacterium]